LVGFVHRPGSFILVQFEGYIHELRHRLINCCYQSPCLLVLANFFFGAVSSWFIFDTYLCNLFRKTYQLLTELTMLGVSDSEVWSHIRIPLHRQMEFQVLQTHPFTIKKDLSCLFMHESAKKYSVCGSFSVQEALLFPCWLHSILRTGPWSFDGHFVSIFILLKK
jgi:hypothetical protein